MQLKTTSKLFFFFIFIVSFSTISVAQTVGGVGTTNNCTDGGTITASSTGLTTPEYQLLLDGAVIFPAAGDADQFTDSNIFSGLFDGTYVVRGRESIGSTVYVSDPIVIVNGYVEMQPITNSATVSCDSGSAQLTTQVTAGGKANYTYRIKQLGSSTILQESGSISATTFTFDALPVGEYVIETTDSCGTTVTSAASVSQTGVLIDDVFPFALKITRTAEGVCGSPIKMEFPFGLSYDEGINIDLTAEDKANFTWRLEYNGGTYGQDANGDGFPDLNGAPFPATTISITLPEGEDDAVAAIAGEPIMILTDGCGNEKRFKPSVNDYYKTQISCSPAEYYFLDMV